MKRQEPAPPLLFTMIMNAMVMPRTTSRESSRLTGLGASAGLVISTVVEADERLAIAILISVQPDADAPYPTRPGWGSPRGKSGRKSERSAFLKALVLDRPLQTFKVNSKR